ncbi:MAG: secondary thiamine-phosphate synthase enzyme YjbQ [Erysipelotrichaceae bacterium]|nr:secondary thiamine-phosphate synthase enzyme YjbQ [Erysipelotrichaceae bacterium]
MVYIKEFKITTSSNSLTKISEQVKETIAKSGVRNGTVVVETAHSTAGILKVNVCGNEILDDIVKEMRRVIPSRINFYHQDGPENASGHIKSSLFGTSVSLIVKDGKPICEGKQDIYFAEYDGPRERSFSVCVSGE